MSKTDENATMKPKPIRRVVTGHDSAGKAVVVADGPSNDVQILPAVGVAIADIWAVSNVPTQIDAWEKRDPNAPMGIDSGVGGLNLRVLQFDPLPAGAITDAESTFADLGSAGAHVANARHPAMHRTDSVDFGIIISGSLTLLLDEEDVMLNAGDVVIQRGTNHAWENRGTTPCLVAIVAVDAEK